MSMIGSGCSIKSVELSYSNRQRNSGVLRMPLTDGTASIEELSERINSIRDSL